MWDGTRHSCSATEWTRAGWAPGSPAESQGLPFRPCCWKRTWKSELISIIYREPSTLVYGFKHELNETHQKQNMTVLSVYRFFLATIPYTMHCR